MINIEPATTRLADLVRDVPEERLSSFTPCDCTVGELLDHIQSFAGAFRVAAEKAEDSATGGPPPTPNAARLGNDWRDRIPQLLTGLANAWNEPSAWQGMTKAGGLEMPGEAAGIVALDEVVLHSWDLAVGSGQLYEPPLDLVAALMPFLEHMAEPEMKPAREGLFGPVIHIHNDSDLFERALALAGRRPT